MNGFSTFVGLRYLRSKKNSAFLSLITFLSIAGVALGVATLIVTLSVMDGFEDALKSRMAGGDFHILVTRAGEDTDPYFQIPVERIHKLYDLSPDILSVNPVLTTEAILRQGSKVGGMAIRGISEAQMSQLAPSLVEAKEGPKVLSRDGLWLGRDLAYQLNLLPGEKVQVVSPIETEGPLESVPRVRAYQVDGVFESGVPEKDASTAYASLEAVQEFLARPGMVSRLEIRVKDFERSERSAELIRAELGEEYRVQDWNQLNTHLFSSLKLERITMFVILAMIILVASFNIITSLRMTVAEKRKEIAILQAMGASRRQIGRIFLVQGAVIGNIGNLIGLILGLAVCLVLKNAPLLELPEIFLDRTIPVIISPWFVAFVVIIATLIVVLASLFPARAAAKISPIEGIRNS